MTNGVTAKRRMGEWAIRREGDADFTAKRLYRIAQGFSPGYAFNEPCPEGAPELGRPIESTREALVHFGRRFRGAFRGAQPRAKAPGYDL